jgi:N-acetyltransferase
MLNDLLPAFPLAAPQRCVPHRRVRASPCRASEPSVASASIDELSFLMKQAPMVVKPVILTGRMVRLEPLSMGHVGELTEAGRYAEVWTYLDEESATGAQSIGALIREALDQQAKGERLAFAMMEPASGRAVGSISYLDIERDHRSVEIGWAWITPNRWSTGMSREAGYLLLQHAFETMGAIRVWFQTDSRNERSQRDCTPRTRASSATTGSCATGWSGTRSSTA